MYTIVSLSQTQRPEDRNRSFTLPFPTNDSDYLFTIEMMCINQHGLSTGVSTSDSFNGSNCVVVEPPTPSPSSSSVLMMMPTTSLTASETPTAPTTEPGKLFGRLARMYVCMLAGQVKQRQSHQQVWSGCLCLLPSLSGSWRGGRSATRRSFLSSIIRVQNPSCFIEPLFLGGINLALYPWTFPL